MMDEGVIKFQCNWINSPLPVDVPDALMFWRDKMHQLGLIGVYEENNIGYGNISIRLKEGMLISGTQTGNLTNLLPAGYSLVSNHDLEQNHLSCIGQVKASAESITHLSFYESSLEIGAVIHVHNTEMWNRLLDKVPTSKPDVPYGTPEMANEIKRLFKETPISREKIMVMGGHQDGVISFGQDLNEAANVILKWH